MYYSVLQRTFVLTVHENHYCVGVEIFPSGQLEIRQLHSIYTGDGVHQHVAEKPLVLYRTTLEL